MFFAEFLKRLKFNQITDPAGSGLLPLSLKQTLLDPRARLAVFHAEMLADLPKAHSVFAESGMFLSIQQVVQRLWIVAESRGRGLHTVIANIIDQGIHRARIESPPELRAWSLDSMLIQESPARALVVACYRCKFFAESHRVLVLLNQRKRLRRPSSPASALGA